MASTPGIVSIYLDIKARSEDSVAFKEGIIIEQFPVCPHANFITFFLVSKKQQRPSEQLPRKRASAGSLIIIAMQSSIASYIAPPM